MTFPSLPPSPFYQGGDAALYRPWGAAAGIAILAFMVGTGGISDAEFLQKRQDRGYGMAAVRVAPTDASAPVRSPAEALARIRSVLNPTVAALADLFSVSRQALYNWANGGAPTNEHARQLNDLARASDILAGEIDGKAASVLKRKIIAGKTLFEIAKEGGSAEDAAHRLALTLRRESKQRKRLDAKLAGRQHSAMPVDAFGAPMLDELG